MSKSPVLDDCTRTANIIGTATTAEEAAKVYQSYFAARTPLGDGESLTVPAYQYRLLQDLSLDDPDDADAVADAGGAWEPLF
ncbi:MAG: hypothetical protein F8N15_00410 [Methanobacterium sp.]|nr:hypothetical protein [Methanobacterium sp.]